MLGTMLDGRRLGTCVPDDGAHLARLAARVPVTEQSYLIALQPRKRGRLHVYDGSCSRPGGPKLANDARGTGMVANMMLLPSGTFCVRRFKEVSRLRAGASPQERRKAELCWSYGDAYWAHPPHAKKLRTAR